MIHDSITFSPGFYTHLGTSLSPIPPKPIEETKEIFEAKEQPDITPNRILKRGSIENLDGFLKTTEKIVRKKRQSAIAFKQKSNMAPTFEKDVEDVAMIGADAYRLAC